MSAASPAVSPSRRLAVFAVVLFALALAPRMLGRDVFVTSDEDSWMRRTGGFTYGLSIGQLGRTYQNGHPGVTTMWLALLGQGPSGAIRFADPVHGQRFVTRVPGFFEALVDARRAFALANAALVAGIGLAAWRLLGPGPAMLGTGLLALDPFHVAHSQLVHMDGLLAGLVTLGALCAAVRWLAGGGRGWIVAAGVLTGLGLLTKAPAVFLLAFVPALALARPGTEGEKERRREGEKESSSDARTLSSSPSLHLSISVPDLALWAGLAALVFVALWPSMWVNPGSSLTRMLAFVRETGGEPDEVGSFFLGEVSPNPGPLFYPVALAFRLTPVGTLGLLLLLGLAWPLRSVLRPRLPGLLAVGLLALGFGLLVTLAPKKFDRYGLPAIPAVLLLAGLGWWLLWRQARPWLAGWSASGGIPAAVGGLVLLGLQAAAPASVFPYYMAYFNPLLGGGPAAARTVMVGNGEGMDQAAAWIRARPEVDQLWVASHSFDLLLATCGCDGEPLRERVPNDAHLIVVYGRRIQMRRWGGSLEQYFAQQEPLHRVWINGMEMARVYPGPRWAGVADSGTAGRRDGETARSASGGRDGETAGRRDSETAGRRDSEKERRSDGKQLAEGR